MIALVVSPLLARCSRNHQFDFRGAATFLAHAPALLRRKAIYPICFSFDGEQVVAIGRRALPNHHRLHSLRTILRLALLPYRLCVSGQNVLNTFDHSRYAADGRTVLEAVGALIVGKLSLPHRMPKIDCVQQMVLRVEK